ncbi:MAG: hypothetical protein M0Z89_06945 [Nitrospiraceae bacterium]|nr:hypothetical protein [Nitrospiraceae bacterium]
MSTLTKRRTAEEFYNAGYTLFQEHRFEQALVKLRQAEEMFRTLDAPGHAFSHPLPNGVTGLANTLALMGRCYYELDDTVTACTYYETSLINAKFEQARPFRLFFKTLREDMLLCYDREAGKIDKATLKNILSRETDTDTSCRFPFSLTGAAFTVARLYELAPDRYPQFSEFFIRMQQQDRQIRRTNKQSDESRMKMASIYIWVLLGTLWIIYSVIVVKTMLIM